VLGIGRRKFIALLGGAATTWPLAAWAQQGAKRIGMLVPYGESDPEIQLRVRALREALARLGWIENHNIQIDLRFGPDAESMSKLARELVDLQPDLIMTDSTPPTASVRQHARTIPIVFVQVGDPVGSGFVNSISRPGGNATGFTNVASSMSSKWFELLREIAPSIVRATCCSTLKPRLMRHRISKLSNLLLWGSSLTGACHLFTTALRLKTLWQRWSREAA
jgi:putative ABC transport system substrate-binding protein